MRKKSLNLFFVLFLGAALFSGGISQAEVESESVSGGISIDLKSVDIIELLRILSLKTGRTIVPGKSLSGRITIFLNNVSFDDVLDIILLSQGLACHKSGKIIYVMTNTEYKAIHGKDYMEARKMSMVKLSYAKPAGIFNAISQLKSEIGKIIVDEASGTIILMDIPDKLKVMENTITELDHSLETAVYDLNYAKPADAKTALSAAITPGTGEVIIDERSGKAIISDLPKKMEKLEDIVKAMDEEARQVFIEGEIVQVTLSDKYQRGIDWEKVFGEGVESLDLIGYFPVSPALSTYQKISVGTLAEDRYKMVINLLDTFGDTEVLSQPKLAIVNKEEASIMVGSREAYVTQTSSQSTSTTVTSESVEFIDVGIKLKVTPSIGSDGFITIKIKPEVSSVRETLTTSLGSNIPIVQTSEAETTVKIKDGVTIMLGGMVENRYTDSVEGIPGLSRLPVLGNLFGRRTKETKKTEMIIFITPHLIRGDAPRQGTELEKFIPEGIKQTQGLEEARSPEARDKKELEKQEVRNKKETERREAIRIKEVKKSQAEGKLAQENEAAKRINESQAKEEKKSLADAERKRQEQEQEAENKKQLEEQEAKSKKEIARQELKNKKELERRQAKEGKKSLAEAERKRQEQEQEAENKKQLEEQEAKSKKEIARQELKNKKELERRQAKETREALAKQAADKEAAEKEEAKILKESSKPPSLPAGDLSFPRKPAALLASRRSRGPLGRRESSSPDSIPRPDRGIKPGNDMAQGQKELVPLKSPPEELNRPYKSKTGLLAYQAESHYNEGLVLQGSLNLAEAKVYYHKVILLDHQYAPAYNQLGIIAQEEDLLEEAQAYYLRAIYVDASFAPAYSNLALLAEADGDFEKAAGYWQKRAKLGRKRDPWVKLAKKRLKEINER